MPPPGPYWQTKLALARAVADAVRREPPADLVVAMLHAGALAAADVLYVPSYEALCRNAFSPAGCGEPHDCRTCPAAVALDPAERDALATLRAGHEAAFARARLILADSDHMADAVGRWHRRDAVVIPPVVAATDADASFAGHVLLAANSWAPHKGLELLAPLCACAGRRREVRVTARGLDRPLPARVVGNAPAGELLAGASLLLVPSQWDEPFGRLAFEALSAGVPVLAADAGGMRGFVPDPVAPRDDVTEWERRIDAVLADETVWREAARRGREAAAGLLDPDPVELLERALGLAA